MSGREIREMIADIVNSIERIMPYVDGISYDELMIGRNRLTFAIRSQSGYYCAVKKVNETGSRYCFSYWEPVL
jgi:hypothetical protein